MVNGNEVTKEAIKRAPFWVVNKLQYQTGDAEDKSNKISNGDVCKWKVCFCVHKARSFLPLR